MRKQPKKPDTPTPIYEGDHDAPWIDALTEIDMFLKKKPWGPKTHQEATALLCKLFRDRQVELSLEIRVYLADLVERVEFHRPPGRQRTPAHTISQTNWNWWLAIRNMHEYIRGGMPEEKAMDKAARDFGHTKEQLKNVLDGKHGSFRIKKRKR
jgi:hypothetical protein